MSTLENSIEQRLINALRTTVKEARVAASPTEALIKVAKEYQLTPAQTQTLAHSYNTARSISNHQKRAGHERCDDFPLVDPHAAADAVDRFHFKSASEQFAASRLRSAASDGVPNFYELDAAAAAEAFAAEEAAQTKTASVAAPESSVFTPAAVPPKHERYDTWQTKKANLRAFELDQARYERELEEATIKTAACVRDHLRTLPFAELEDGLIARYGSETGVKIANVVYTVIDGAGLRQSRSTGKTSRRIFDYTLTPYIEVDRFVQAVLAAESHNTKLASAASEEVAARDSFIEPTSSRCSTSFSNTLETSIFDDSVFKTASAIPLKGYLDGSAYPSRVFEAEQAFQESLDAEQARTNNPNVREVKVKAMLKELMAADDVISRYGVDEVIDRYNDIADVAPAIIDKPVIMRGILRRALQQGNVDPFEVGQYLSMNKQQQETGSVDTSLADAASATADTKRGQTELVRSAERGVQQQDAGRKDKELALSTSREDREARTTAAEAERTQQRDAVQDAQADRDYELRKSGLLADQTQEEKRMNASERDFLLKQQQQQDTVAAQNVGEQLKREELNLKRTQVRLDALRFAQQQQGKQTPPGGGAAAAASVDPASPPGMGVASGSQTPPPSEAGESTNAPGDKVHPWMGKPGPGRGGVPPVPPNPPI